MNRSRVLVTGSKGFIGKNLVVRLKELGFSTEEFAREDSDQDLISLIKKVDFIIHLAGENRPKDDKAFDAVNAGLTVAVCNAARSSGRKIPIILASSTQAGNDSPYGKSKFIAEGVVRKYGQETGIPVFVYRLPGVFGKWCKPNYNSVVATFCYNISRNLPIVLTNPDIDLHLVYIDDVVECFVSVLKGKVNNQSILSIQPEYVITLGQLAAQTKCFYESRKSLESERVGSGLIRKLYATYVSYIAPENFSYPIASYSDERGVFAEVLKTKDSGQFSFFTAGPGVTRGGHYHHSKTEKFLVIQGVAKFGFRHVVSDETFELTVSGKDLTIVETVPGWSHDITNTGKEAILVMLWANETFDADKPDTIAYKVLNI